MNQTGESRAESPEPQGRVEAIWIKRYRGGPMDPVKRALLHAGRGIEGNANQGGKRQVTLLDLRVWEEASANVAEWLEPALRRANVLLDGVTLEDTRGRILAVGGVRLLIHGETKPCRLMDEAAPGLQAALRERWAGGVFAEVLDNGEILVGDPVRFV